MSQAKNFAVRFFALLWSALRNATVRYVGGVILLFACGAAGIFLGHIYLDGSSVAYGVVLSLSEALVVSAFLTVLVDPFLKRRIEDEAAWSGVFGYLNARAPKGLRRALRDLADCKVYYTRTSWRISFEWEDESAQILAVTLQVRSVGENISREPYALAGQAWILASTAGYQSKYLRYGVSCPGGIDAVDEASERLQPHVRTLPDGSVYVDEKSVCQDQEIPQGKVFEIVKEAVMYRHATGYVPLHHGKFGENLTITLEGGALTGIDVRVSHPSRVGRALPSERRRSADGRPNPDSTRFKRVTPGQVTIISWKAASDGLTLESSNREA